MKIPISNSIIQKHRTTLLTYVTMQKNITGAAQICIIAVQYDSSHDIEMHQAERTSVFITSGRERLQTKRTLILSQDTVYQEEKVQSCSGVVIALQRVLWTYAPSGGQKENPPPLCHTKIKVGVLCGVGWL